MMMNAYLQTDMDKVSRLAIEFWTTAAEFEQEHALLNGN
jgi:hypothetical protein